MTTSARTQISLGGTSWFIADLIRRYIDRYNPPQLQRKDFWENWRSWPAVAWTQKRIFRSLQESVTWRHRFTSPSLTFPHRATSSHRTTALLEIHRRYIADLLTRHIDRDTSRIHRDTSRYTEDTSQAPPEYWFYMNASSWTQAASPSRLFPAHRDTPPLEIHRDMSPLEINSATLFWTLRHTTWTWSSRLHSPSSLYSPCERNLNAYRL